MSAAVAHDRRSIGASDGRGDVAPPSTAGSLIRRRSKDAS